MKAEKYLKLKVLVFLVCIPLIVPAAGFVYVRSKPIQSFFKHQFIKKDLTPIYVEDAKQSINQELRKPESFLQVHRVRNKGEITNLKEQIALTYPVKSDVFLAQGEVKEMSQKSFTTRDLKPSQRQEPQTNTPNQAETHPLQQVQTQWVISGQVIYYNKDTNDQGHYEVGYYDVVGSDDLPNPSSRLLAHQSLASGQNQFKFIFKKQMKGHLVARYFSKNRNTFSSYPLKTTAVYNANPIQMNRDYNQVFLFIGQHKPKTYALSGRILTDYSNVKPYAKPLSGVSVQIEGSNVELRTDSEGFFYLDGLKHLDGYLKIDTGEGTPQRMPVYLDTSRYFDIAYKPQAHNSIVGQVLSENGFPRAGIRVVLQDLEKVQTTREDGTFTFQDISSGHYNLEAYVAGEFLGYYRFSHKLGLTTQLLLQEKEPLIYEGKVLSTSLVKNQNGNPVSEALVRVVGYPIEVKTSSEGAFSLGPLSSFQDYVELEIDHSTHFLSNIKYKKDLNFIYLPRNLSFEDQKLPVPINPQEGNLWGDLSYFNEELKVVSFNPSIFSFYMNKKGVDFMAQHTLQEGRYRLSFLNIPQDEETFAFYSKQGEFRGLISLFFPAGYTTLLLP